MYVASMDQMSASCRRPIHIVFSWVFRRKTINTEQITNAKTIIIRLFLLFFIITVLQVFHMDANRPTYGYLLPEENGYITSSWADDVLKRNRRYHSSFLFYLQLTNKQHQMLPQGSSQTSKRGHICHQALQLLWRKAICAFSTVVPDLKHKWKQ